MADEETPIQIVLTPEQRALIRRASGRHVEALELTADSGPAAAGGVMRFLWRLSAATGVPRQGWVRGDKSGEKP